MVKKFANIMQMKISKGRCLLDIYEHLSISACTYVSTCNGCNIDYVFKIIPVYKTESSCSKLFFIGWFFGHVVTVCLPSLEMVTLVNVLIYIH